MGLTQRQPGDRRWGMLADFPLKDSDDAHVVCDRRSGDDRRKAPADMEDLLILFSQLPSVDPGHKQ